MKIITLLLLLQVFPAAASIVGISTHPLNDRARVISAEMTGFMSQRHEMGMGLRYTQEVSDFRRLDVTASGGQDSRALTVGAGMDFELLSEELYQPRFSIKPYMHYQKFEESKESIIGAAPTLRKGFSVNGQEFFPYLAVPTGIRLDTSTDEFVYYSSLTLGASLPFPGDHSNKLLISLEGNMDMGASSDYVACLVSWIWK